MVKYNVFKTYFKLLIIFGCNNKIWLSGNSSFFGLPPWFCDLVKGHKFVTLGSYIKDYLPKYFKQIMFMFFLRLSSFLVLRSIIFLSEPC